MRCLVDFVDSRSVCPHSTPLASAAKADMTSMIPTSQFFVATFYEFFHLEDPSAQRTWLLERLAETDIRGSVLVATEGINGTLAGDETQLQGLLDQLRGSLGIDLGNCKFSSSPFQPFKRLRVRARSELVTFKQPLADPGERTGTYVPPADWDEVLRRDDVRVVDARNDFEIAVGSFEGAEDPCTQNFTDFAEFAAKNLDPTRDRAIAMYCTGGIRCEKASSYLLAKGFETVYHLEGGILRYFEEIDAKESSFQGECYVFDERVSVDQELEPGAFANCENCGWPVRQEQVCDSCGVNQCDAVANDWRARSRASGG